MIIKIEDLLRQPFPQPDIASIARLSEIFINRLKVAGYSMETENKQGVERLIEFFAKLASSLISPQKYDANVSAVEAAKKRRNYDTREIPVLIDCRVQMPCRGVLAAGKTGTGKTTLLKLLAAYEYGKTIGVQYFNAADIIEKYQSEGEKFLDAFLSDTEDEVIIIDDLGSERYAKRYGSDSIMPYLLDKRYRCFTAGIPTILITNLSKTDLCQEYGERIDSRLCEMADKIVFTGQDWRTKQPHQQTN